MKFSAVPLFLSSLLVDSSQAWLLFGVHNTNNHLQQFSATTTCTATTTTTTTTALLGSRAATKWSNKLAWLEKRGGSSSSSSSSSSTSKDMSSSSSNSVVPAAEIVGAGRIGALLAQAGNCVVIGRNDSIDANKSGVPILIATRNDALSGIVDKCPENRKKDLVFLQNGYLDDFLKEKDLLENTQALLYLSVTAKGVEPVDGVTAVNPEGLTAVTGEHAQALRDRLAGLNLKCRVLTPEEYRPAMFEKLIWISTYMLVGTAKECASVGQAGEEHKDLVEQVVQELTAAVSKAEGLQFPDGVMERLAAYTDVVSDFPCGVKEFEWRNQYFYNLGDQACPTHNALLRECAEKGLIGFELP